MNLNKEYIYDPRRVEAKLPLFKVVRLDPETASA
jgi:hypothetical protein